MNSSINCWFIFLLCVQSKEHSLRQYQNAVKTIVFFFSQCVRFLFCSFAFLFLAQLHDYTLFVKSQSKWKYSLCYQRRTACSTVIATPLLFLFGWFALAQLQADRRFSFSCRSMCHLCAKLWNLGLKLFSIKLTTSNFRSFVCRNEMPVSKYFLHFFAILRIYFNRHYRENWLKIQFKKHFAALIETLTSFIHEQIPIVLFGK